MSDHAESLELRSVSKEFGDFTAVSNVDLKIAPGEFVTLLGPSGSGKTTVLNMVAGFETVTSGDIQLGGRQLTDVPIHRRNIGMVFQGYALFPHMSVEKNIEYPLKQRKLPKSEVNDAVDFAIDTVGLNDFRKRMPSQLSGGQRQRVAVARAFCFRPPLLLMDEPLSALDKSLREHLQQEIRRIHRDIGTTVVYVTHDQDEALALSDRIVVFNHGEIQQVGTPRELYQSPANLFVSQFVGESVTTAGRVEKTAGDRRFNAGPTSVPVTSAHDWSGEATMSVRPENVKISRAAGEIGDPSDHECVVEGVISDVTFVGNAIKYKVDTDQGGGVVRAAGVDDPVGDVGQKVWLRWRASDARVLQGTTTAEQESGEE